MLSWDHLIVTLLTSTSTACPATQPVDHFQRDAGGLSRVNYQKTLREFDTACLAPVIDLAPQAIRDLREREHVSQPVFAAYLNVSRNLVSDWEGDVKKPGGPALRLLGIIQKHGLAALT